ncbi:MAG TPA: hypothetical protein VFU23_03025 [Gemmatimonadales bacterium]|nr:hypothetical protein [Gemmatimonadales bacterium]
MKTPTLLLLGALAAAPLSAQRTRAVVVVPGQLTTIVTDTMGTPYDVPFARGRVYSAVIDALKELKIPAEVLDSADGRVESNVFYRRGDLAGRQISTYLSCGEGITGPYADSYRVYMIAMVTVASKGENMSTVRTIFLAGAVAVAEGARQPMACESTGRLEIRIHKLVLKKAAGL